MHTLDCYQLGKSSTNHSSWVKARCVHLEKICSFGFIFGNCNNSSYLCLILLFLQYVTVVILFILFYFFINNNYYYYRTMHFGAKRGIAIVCCPSVCLSVCLWRSGTFIRSITTTVINNFGKSSHGHSQRLPKFFRASTYYRAHHAVIFALAGLSCYYY